MVDIFKRLKASSWLLLSINMDHKTIDKPAINLTLHVLSEINLFVSFGTTFKSADGALIFNHFPGARNTEFR